LWNDPFIWIVQMTVQSICYSDNIHVASQRCSEY